MIGAIKTEYGILNMVLQFVESDKDLFDDELKSINWNSVEHTIFKIQKQIFEANKN